MNAVTFSRQKGRKPGGLPPRQQVRRARRTVVACQLYYAGIGVQGQGTLSNLSCQGCQVLGTMPVKKGTKLTIILLHPDYPHPMIVDKARVVWSKGRRFGLQYEIVYPSEQEHVLAFLQTLARSRVHH